MTWVQIPARAQVFWPIKYIGPWFGWYKTLLCALLLTSKCLLIVPIGADQFECITIIEHWIAIFGPTHRPITISWKHPQHGRARHTQLVDSLRHTSSIIGYSPWKIRAPDEGLEPTTLELKVWRPTSWATQACWISWPAVIHNQQHHFSICRFQNDPMRVQIPALISFLGLEGRFNHQKKGLDVAEATTSMICARNSSKQARNSEQSRTTSNRCSSAVIDFREKFMKQKFLQSSKPTEWAIIH